MSKILQLLVIAILIAAVASPIKGLLKVIVRIFQLFLYVARDRIQIDFIDVNNPRTFKKRSSKVLCILTKLAHD